MHRKECFLLLKKKKRKKQQAKRGVLAPKPANRDLIAVSASPRSGILNPSVWNFSGRLYRGNLHDETPCSSPEGKAAVTILSFLLIASLSFPISAYKLLPFCTAPWSSSLLAGWDAARFVNCWIKPIPSLNLFSWILCFNTLEVHAN